MNEVLKAHAEKAGLDFDDVKNGFKRLLPIIRPIVRLTPNKVDDAALAFIETLLAADAGATAG